MFDVLTRSTASGMNVSSCVTHCGSAITKPATARRATTKKAQRTELNIVIFKREEETKIVRTFETMAYILKGWQPMVAETEKPCIRNLSLSLAVRGRVRLYDARRAVP